ncbi:hypothetical protein BHE74_00046321 [Ensete ventricosum]|nr:hypothetical protein GW17_00013558 [Ensete ventricosum]RWW47665.1 hypothetical protein BHE74_00046321 [Ensete ventricosum]RZR81766.1 hypothetical protein BHM03_00008061 [Ensete ventricosum]
MGAALAATGLVLLDHHLDPLLGSGSSCQFENLSPDKPSRCGPTRTSSTYGDERGARVAAIVLSPNTLGIPCSVERSIASASRPMS